MPFLQRYSKLFSNKFVFPISMVQMIRTLGRSQVWVFTPLYLLLIRHVPYEYIGILFFATAILSVPFSLYGGNLIDSIGRRPLAVWLPLFGAFLLIVMLLGVGLDLSIFVVYLAFVFEGPVSSMEGILDNVVTTDSTTETERLYAFSFIRIAANLGFAVGPAVGGFLSSAGYTWVFLFPALLTFVEWGIYLKYIKETGKSKEVHRAKMEIPKSDKAFLIMAILMGSIFFASGQWGTTLTLFWSRFDLVSNPLIGILYSVNGIGVVLLQLPVNRVLDKVRSTTRLSIGGLFYAFGFLILAFSSNFAFLVVDVVILTVGENVLTPAFYTIVSKMAPSERRGQYFGTFQLISGMIMPLAPVLGSVLLTYYIHSPLILWGIIFAIGTSVSAIVYSYGPILRRSGRKDVN